MNFYIKILLAVLLVTVNSSDPIDVVLSEENTFNLTKEKDNLVGQYRVQVNKTPENQSKWYFFALAEPKAESTFVGFPTEIDLKVEGNDGKEKFIKKCKLLE